MEGSSRFFETQPIKKETEPQELRHYDGNPEPLYKYDRVRGGFGITVSDFQSTDHRQIANDLIDDERVDIVLEKLDDFKYIDFNKIALAAIKQEEEDKRMLVDRLDKFSDLNFEVAKGLVSDKYAKKVAENIKSFNSFDHRAIADLFIQRGFSETLIKNLEKFNHDLDYNKIAHEILFKKDKALDEKTISLLLAENLKKFTGLDLEVAEFLMSSEGGRNSLEVAKNIDSFASYEHKRIAPLFLLSAYFLADLFNHIENFKNTNLNKLKEQVIKIHSSEGIRALIMNIDKVGGLSDSQIDEIIRRHYGRFIFDQIDKFPGYSKIEIARKMVASGDAISIVDELGILTLEERNELSSSLITRLIESGYPSKVPEIFDQFTNIDYQKVANELAERAVGAVVLKNASKFVGIDIDSVVFIMLGKMQSSEVAKYIDICPRLKKETVDALISEFISLNKFQDILAVSKIYGFQDKDLERAYELFGDFTTKQNYLLVKEMMSGDLTEENKRELEILGIKKNGPEGIQELRQATREFTGTAFTMDGPDGEKILDSTILLDSTKKIVRFSTASFGTHDDLNFQKTIENYVKAKSEAAPLRSEYRPSHIMEIKSVDQEKQEATKISEQTLARFKVFQDGLREAVTLLREPTALTSLITRINEKIKVKQEVLGIKLEGAPNEKAKESIKKSIQRLESIKIGPTTNWQETFTQLASFKDEFREELLPAVFWWSLQLKPDSLSQVNELIEVEEPKIDDISTALDFVDHITNQEVLKKYFSETEAAKKFNSLLNVSALQEEISRLQNQDSKGLTKMQFVPGRNLLTEFSGHIADACWASKYDSIIERFPNFTSLMMVLNPDNPQTRRLAGAAFLIEAEAIDGSKLLIIRGLNPQENVINSLKVSDFYKQITDYLKEIAGSMGARLAIVIDAHSGGSASNRPVLYNHLSGLTDRLQKIRPARDEDTAFNGYHIQSNVYLV